MKPSPFPSIGTLPAVVCFLQFVLFGGVLLSTAAEEDRQQRVSVDGHKAAGLECLATTADLDSFRCVKASGASPRTRYRCVDENKRCGEWGGHGECKNNPQFMLVECRKTCSSCIPLHSGDEAQMAADEKTRLDVLGRLYETQNYLHRLAKNNVEHLKRCVNKDSRCTHWWSIGECGNNPRFMQTECGPACQTC